MFPKSIQAIYDSDWVLRVLKKIFNSVSKRFGAITSILILSIIPISLIYISGYIEGTFYNTRKLLGVVGDYSLYVTWPVIWLTLFIFFKFAQSVERFFSQNRDIVNSCGC